MECPTSSNGVYAKLESLEQIWAKLIAVKLGLVHLRSCERSGVQQASISSSSASVSSLLMWKCICSLCDQTPLGNYLQYLKPLQLDLRAPMLVLRVIIRIVGYKH